LDDSFGDNGLVLTSIVDMPTNMVVQANDGILVGLDTGRVARFDANGCLDPTFGVGGVSVLPDASPYVTGKASNMVVLPDGRIMVAVWVGHQTGMVNPGIALVRYLSDGNIDLSLGNGHGIAVLEVDSNGAQPAAVATWPGPKGLCLVVAGKGALAIRTDLEGVLDTTFANGSGWVAPQVATWGTTTMAVQPDGKILLVGSVFSSSRGNDFGIIRINADGTRDQLFGGTGVVATEFAEGFDDHALAIALLPDTRFLVSGFTLCVGPICPANFAVARYWADGTPDSSFGNQGKVIVGNGNAAAIAMVQGGAIVMGGSSRPNIVMDLGGGWGTGSPEWFSLSRLTSAGELDQTFGAATVPGLAGGLVMTSFGDAYTRSFIMTLSVQSTGMLVAAGSVGAYAGGDSHIGLARYRP
jgi:uncharacterized delta-60 repeat protein